jgi:hypothetical protein
MEKKTIGDKEFVDISDEKIRVYHYPGGDVFVIENPVYLNVSQSSMGGHSHRIVCKVDDGYRSIYVAPGWKAITWDNNDTKDLDKTFIF